MPAFSRLACLRLGRSRTGDLQKQCCTNLGDGDTDIPSMKMVRQKGGQSVAVFAPELFEQRTGN
ncbi:MAG: hypothetical protein WCJ18_08390 [Planctomycetota bacterium]